MPMEMADKTAQPRKMSAAAEIAAMSYAAPMVYMTGLAATPGTEDEDDPAVADEAKNGNHGML